MELIGCGRISQMPYRILVSSTVIIIIIVIIIINVVMKFIATYYYSLGSTMAIAPVIGQLQPSYLSELTAVSYIPVT